MSVGAYPGSTRDRWGIGAITIYVAFSALFIGRALPGHLSTVYIGKSSDPSVYMWFLVWWPHAIAHRLNPFVTRLLWAPLGFNVTWTTGVPLAALVAAPITMKFGPVVAYNVLAILSPGLSAWTAFLLCRRITKRYAAALAGGYVYGFSAYMLAESRAHLVLVLVFLIPVAVSVVVARLEDRIGPRRFAVVMAAVLVGQFLCSLEILATMTLFGALAIALAIAFTSGDARARIRALIPPIGASYLIAALLMSPYLYFFFQPGFPRVNSPAAYSSDLLNFIVPTRVNALGSVRFFAAIASRFPGNPLEAGAYVGLPMVVIAILFGVSRKRDPLGRILSAFLIIAVVATLGPRLHIAGVTLFGMPWKVMQHLPLLSNILPARFAVYIGLALAIVVSLWLSASEISIGAKAIAVTAIAIFLFPNPDASFWVQPNDTPEFFLASDTDGFRQHLVRDEIAVVLPYGLTGRSMLWQAETAMYFRMTGGWTSVTPREFESWPIVTAFETSTYIPDASKQLLAFMAAHDCRLVIVDEAHAGLWAPLLSGVDSNPTHVDGVVLFRARSDLPGGDRKFTALAMERRNDEQRLIALISAAQEYLRREGDLARLTPRAVAQNGLLPGNWVAESDVRTRNGLYLGPWPGGRIAVGVVGSYDGLRPLIDRYGPLASTVYFPYPHPLTADGPKGDTFMRQLVFVFDRGSLARAATLPGPPSEAPIQ